MSALVVSIQMGMAGRTGGGFELIGNKPAFPPLRLRQAGADASGTGCLREGEAVATAINHACKWANGHRERDVRERDAGTSAQDGQGRLLSSSRAILAETGSAARPVDCRWRPSGAF